MRLASGLLVLAACGRVHFAARGIDAAPVADAMHDVVLGHDEDGDGIPDSEDPCPHIPGDRADRDGDGVGDACDPNPDTPTEHWLLFATMQPGDTAFDDLSGWEQEPDDIHGIAGTLGTQITRPVGTVRVEIGFDIRALVGTGQHQVASGIDNPMGSVYYFVELNDNNTLQDLGVVSYDSTNGYSQLGMQTNTGAKVGPGVVRYDATLGPSPSFTAAGGWNGEIDHAMGPTPSYTGGQDVRFAFNGIDIAIRYVVMIATN